MSIPLFRLASITYKAFRAPKMQFWEKVEIRTKVHPNDLDINIHMNNSRFGTMFDLGRMDFLVKTGLIKFMWRQKWRPIVGAMMISFKKSVKLYEKFVVSTRVVYVDDKWFYLEHLLLKGGQMMARSYAKCLFLKKDKKISTFDLLQALGTEAPIDLIPPISLLSWIKAEEDLRLEV